MITFILIYKNITHYIYTGDISWCFLSEKMPILGVIYWHKGFLGGLVVNNPSFQCKRHKRHVGLNPVAKIPGGGNANSVQAYLPRESQGLVDYNP